MGVSITIKGADFSSAAIAFSAPVTDRLEFWNYYGGTSDKTAKNLVIGKPGVSVIGAPAVSAGYATFTKVINYVRTALLDQPEVTHLVAARFTGAGGSSNSYLIGDFSAASLVGYGSNLYFNGSSAVSNASVIDGSGSGVIQVVTTPITDVTKFYFLVGRQSAATCKINNKTTGASASATPQYPRSVSANQYSIGGNSAISQVSVAPCDIAFAAIYSRVLTDSEITAIYTKVQSNLAGKSIVI